MNKKTYIKPQTSAFAMEPQAILAGSTRLDKASNDDYTEENIKDMRDASNNIWAD